MQSTFTSAPATPLHFVTFAVDDVHPASDRLPECRAYEAIGRVLGRPLESCSDYHSRVVDRIHYQPLLAAVYTAFSQHRPLVLSPDAVWITIAQGVAHHMATHGETLRSRFVRHQGKLELALACNDWVEGSPENPWAEAFAGWSAQIREHVGAELHAALACDFSTTGPVERAVGDIVMMDVFERYFKYVMYCICGVPTVTLEGTPDDWQRLTEKAAALRVFDLGWWLDSLLPICEQFVRASRGDVDLPHWQSICKLREEYGGDIINGWVARLFPYLRSFIDGPCAKRNPIFETGEGFQTSFAPSGLSRVPFEWRNLVSGRVRRMEAIGGLVGVSQNPDTLALRPRVGWAISEPAKIDGLFARLVAEHQSFAASSLRRGSVRPADLEGFYLLTNGAHLFGQDQSAVCRILPREQLEPLDWREASEECNSRGPGGRIWHRFAVLGDGRWLAMNLDLNMPRVPDVKRGDIDDFAPICVASSSTQDQPGQNPVIALSFTEFLERMLEGEGSLDWFQTQHQKYGDAERFTRRD